MFDFLCKNTGEVENNKKQKVRREYMSAFLGPIHSWLYNKICFQDELTQRIMKRTENEGAFDNFDFIDNKYGKLAEGNLEDIVDENNIHGWLQERVSMVEKRLAAVVTCFMKDRPEALNSILVEAYHFGQKYAVDGELNAMNIYEHLESILLNGMPCDYVNSIITDNETSVTW